MSDVLQALHREVPGHQVCAPSERSVLLEEAGRVREHELAFDAEVFGACACDGGVQQPSWPDVMMKLSLPVGLVHSWARASARGDRDQTVDEAAARMATIWSTPPDVERS